MDCKKEIEIRTQWLKRQLDESGAKGFVYGNSGGKDCTLAGALCKLASENTVSIMMPCESSVNYGSDREDALAAAEKFGITTEEVDLTAVKAEFRKTLGPLLRDAPEMAYANINPRLRMITLYAYAYKHNFLVVGTGNLSERTMGYFTKWGDGAYDINPIADLAVTQIYELLRYLDAPKTIIGKQPSAGLYEGQTDEKEMGISYAAIDEYLLNGRGSAADLEHIKRAYERTAHKRAMPRHFKP